MKTATVNGVRRFRLAVAKANKPDRQRERLG
jgi:hypothetical protein